jgi:predicted secreted protein
MMRKSRASRVKPEQGRMHRFDDPARAIRVAPGEVFAIALAGNPTTGYTWQADFDGQCLALIEQTFEPAGQGVGAGAREVFRFRAVRRGTTQIGFVYQRPWGGEPHDAKRFRVVIA